MTQVRETHSREIRFPSGTRILVEDFVTLVALAAEECAKGLDWNVKLGDREWWGKDVASLGEKLRETHGKIDAAWCRAGESPLSENVVLTLWGGVTISGADRNWVAGTKERFQEEIDRRVRRSFWWRWQRSPIILLWMVLAGGFMAWLISTGKLVMRDSSSIPPWLAILFVVGIPALLAGFVASFATARGGFFGTPRLVLTQKGFVPGLWFQHPVVESAKTVAIFSGGLWALLQIVRLLKSP